MQAQRVFLCCLAYASASASVSSSQLQVTPVQKVVTLLQGMLAKGKKEKHDEEVTFAAQKVFCDETKATKERTIKEEVATEVTLKALISKDVATTETLVRKIGTLNKDQDTWEGDLKAAKKVRDIEKNDYTTLHKDYTESLDAIKRAVTVMKKQAHDRAQEAKESFIQLSALKNLRLIPDHAKATIETLLQQDEREDDAADAPEANAYEFQSNGVIDMLSKLLDKFTEELTALEKKEVNAVGAYNMLNEDLTAEVSEAGKDETEKTESKATTLGKKADETEDLKAEKKLEEEDTKYVKDVKAKCTMEAADFEARQELRSQEITAIEKAIEIISGDAVAGNAGQLLPTLVQNEGVVLSQLRSNLNNMVQQRVSKFLRGQAAKLNSRILSTVSDRIAADPYKKVKKMIKDLVVRLMEEANEEADHKGYCDTELTTNKQTREEKSASVETLTAEIDSLEAAVAKLTSTISELSKQVTALDAAMQKATELRIEEKTKNAATIKDSQDAQTAVAQALTVLREFYDKAAEATSFVQIVQPYQGMQSEKGGVIGMLEVISTDFARLESETSASEATATKDHDLFMTDSKVDKADKSSAVQHKKAKMQDKQQALTTSQADLEGTQKELDAALAYFEKLKPSCIDSGASYEDRVERRKGELESLQEALKIISGEDIA